MFRYLCAVLFGLTVTAPIAHPWAAAAGHRETGENPTDPTAAYWALERPGPRSARWTDTCDVGGGRTPCVITGVLFSFPSVVTIDTTDDLNTMSGYPACNTKDESGPEEVYEITVPEGGPYVVSAAVIDDGPTVDLDVFILSEPCDSDNCLSSGNITASVTGVPSGTTLYISVDGFGGSSGVGTLTVDCTYDTHVFSDDFESGNSSNWSNVVP